MQKSRELLSKYWGYPAFRPLQEDIVDAAIYGKDVLALLPTGGGKSICFQVPGLAREGLCIVISPLIALMEDQVNQLKKRGIRAKALTSGMSYKDMDITLDNARFGGLDFLYVSPERIQTRLFQERAKRMEIGLIVVDEAHCISEWGHDFRPSYQQIVQLRELHPDVPMIAVTATATEKVKKDILSSLLMEQAVVFESSFERSNISYEVYPVQSKLKAVMRLCQRTSGQVGIVYCQTRKSVKEVMQQLLAQGIKANMYHGGMNHQERSKALQDWLIEKTPVMVATNAFGMGIDKPNVRFVAHFDIPNNPEAYFQEAGRAGRDGQDARTFVFTEPGDLEVLTERTLAQFPDPERVKHIYRALCSYLKVAIGSGDQESYVLDFPEFSKRFQIHISEVYPAFKILEMNGDLLFSEDGLKGSRLKFTIDNAHLYGFQLKHPQVDALIVQLNRMHSDLFDSFVEIDEYALCKHLKYSPEKLQESLAFLEKNGIIDITWRTNLPMVTFLHERFPDDYLQLKPEVYQFRKERALERLETMRRYVEGKQCRQQYILSYFGQESDVCGKCDRCKENAAFSKHPRLALEILELLTSPRTLDEILEAFDHELALKVKHLLREMLVDERISFAENKYSLPQ
jgi:ATP-dependent DNA helicase RecQ